MFVSCFSEFQDGTNWKDMSTLDLKWNDLFKLFCGDYDNTSIVNFLKETKMNTQEEFMNLILQEDLFGEIKVLKIDHFPLLHLHYLMFETFQLFFGSVKTLILLKDPKESISLESAKNFIQFILELKLSKEEDKDMNWGEYFKCYKQIILKDPTQLSYDAISYSRDLYTIASYVTSINELKESLKVIREE